ncbi:hypothetical protein RFI_22727 [Reticulomyxa filosa]|uniref:Lipase n=1 Tax=Reticulomyxa filosa TaxID=46433 RepID=X6MNF6_RETFI|nr:hypothetical protein RFI_22727 [Reticulomyxa filosa]|eukprot:ETO14640.1 hypothetical protein RFI_22727 [Reticulomyxa filosa]
MVEIVAEKGYPIEEHYITTRDGYILGCFRIPYGRHENDNALYIGKPAVFLMHGLLDSSFTWVNNPINESLGYLLADAEKGNHKVLIFFFGGAGGGKKKKKKGYDVWLGNNRGNRYSKSHVKYKVNSDEFWNFSYDEMAKFDVPDQISYVLNYTNQEKLAFVGHSEGTIQMFAAPTFTRDLESKVAIFGALAPVAWVYHCKSPLIDAMALFHVDTLFEALGVRQFLPGTFINIFAPDLCNTTPDMCGLFLELVCGPSQDLNDSRIEVYVSKTPADTSVKNMVSVRRDKFEMFDYGSDQANIDHYGSKDPPQYNATLLNIPTVLYSGTNDWLADPTDVATLMSVLNPAIVIEHKVVDGFAHLDFVWGIHANSEVYYDLISKITQYLGPGKTSS